MKSIKAPEVQAAALLADRPDEAAIEAFERVGAIVVRGLIGPAWLKHLRTHYDRWADKATCPYADRGGNAHKGQVPLLRANVWEEEEDFRKVLFESPLAQVAATMMRSQTALIYEDLLLVDPAGAKHQTNWHQDGPSWPVSGRQRANIWFSLEDVGPETGSMRFIMGSHLGPMYQPPNFTKPPEADDDMWAGEPFPDIDGNPNHTIVLTDAAPGDAIVFHPIEIHTAYGSAQDHRRRTFTTRFLGDDVRWQPKKYLYHSWMQELGLKKGDKIVTPRLPVVWDAAAQA
jgi:ectoine hydroxylase-related dioxygenase (phytanoyl-CoA dioxygenase family)